MDISIITVTLNNLQGLKQTLDSIKSQNVNQAELLEWIVIDGGSSDNTPNFLNSLCLDFPLIFKSETDKGIFDAMNKGIRLSSGKFVLFLNAGDVLSNIDILSEVSNIFSLNKNHLISGLVEMRYKKIYKISDLKPWVNHQSVFIPRELIVEYMFDENLKYFGDLDLWKRLDKDGFFNVQRIELVFSKFEMGGLGNSPNTIFKRLKERRMIGIRYGDKVPYFVRFIYSIILFFIFRIAGKDAYFKFLLR
jgi:putative colanic acid biosynthesis glycosyltransferase